MTRDVLEEQPGDELRLNIAADALRHRWWLIAAVLLLVTIPVAAYGFTRPPSYESHAKVVLRPIAGNAFSEESAQNAQQVTVAMETEAGLVSSPAVTDLVSKDLGYTVPPGSSEVSATVPPNTQIVDIGFSADSPANAESGANAFAESFLSYRADQATATRARQLDNLQSQAKTAKKSLTTASRQASKLNPPPEAAAQVQLYTSRLASLQDSIGALQATQTDAGTIVTPADVPKGPAGLGPFVLTGLAGVVALLLGFALALWAERRDDRTRPGAISVADLPVLGRLPVDRTHGARLLEHEDEGSLDAYRQVRTGVAALATRPATLMLSAVSAGLESDVVAEVTANLARSLSASGYRVTVVDAAWSEGIVTGVFGAPARPSLADALRAPSLELNLYESDGVAVLPSGSRSPEARELVGSERFPELLRKLSQHTDFLIVAAGPLSSPEGRAAALAGDGVVVLIEEQTTTHREVEESVAQLRGLGVSFLGAVALPRRPGRKGLNRRLSEAPTGGDKQPRTPSEASRTRGDQPTDGAVASGTGRGSV